MKGFITGHKASFTSILKISLKLIQINKMTIILLLQSLCQKTTESPLQCLTFIPNPGNEKKQKNSDDREF